MEFRLLAQRRFGAVLLLACAALCGGCRSGEPKRTVAVITKSTGTDQWRELRDGIQASAASRGWTIQWAAPESEADYTQQADMLEKAIDRHVDGILLTPTHQMVLASAVRRAHDAGIPVVIVDAAIALPSDQYAGYVGSNDVEIGLLAAERAALVLHDKGCVGVIGVSPTLESSSLRERTFRERLQQQSPQVRVCATAYGLSDWGRSAEAVRDMLNQHPEIDLLFASDAFETLGAASEIRQRKHRPALIGVDNEYGRRTAVDRGEIDSLVLEDMRSIGGTAAQMLHDAMNGAHAHRTEEVPVKLRTSTTAR